jgi:uncharacterized damage-inducible protein DinB
MSVYHLLVRHETWATDQLLTFCAGLTPEQRTLSVPGTYGTIEATLQHLVGAKERYHQTLASQPPAAGAVEETAAVDLAQLRRRSEALGAALLEVADLDPERVLERRRRDGTVLTAKAGTILAQLIHHGNDHRTQVETTLSAHGITAGRPDLDVWSFVAAGA